MPLEERDPAHLWDMLDAARAIADFTNDLTLDEFLAAGRDKEITRLAVERKLEILGEAARRVSPRFRHEHPEIPWQQIIGVRNVISHEYEKVNYTLIYRIAAVWFLDWLAIALNVFGVGVIPVIHVLLSLWEIALFGIGLSKMEGLRFWPACVLGLIFMGGVYIPLAILFVR